MAKEIHAALIFWQFHKSKSQGAHVCCKGHILDFKWLHREQRRNHILVLGNVLPICLLSLCILRPPLSLDSHASAKCSSIQGSFHVSVTLLELGYGITQKPSPWSFQVLLFKQCGWWSFALCACLCIFNWVCFMSVCVYAWMYERSMCCRGDRCAYILKHEYVCVCVTTCIICTYLCLYTVFLFACVCFCFTMFKNIHQLCGDFQCWTP